MENKTFKNLEKKLNHHAASKKSVKMKLLFLFQTFLIFKIYDSLWLIIISKFQPASRWLKKHCANALGYISFLFLKDRKTYEVCKYKQTNILFEKIC